MNRKNSFFGIDISFDTVTRRSEVSASVYNPPLQAPMSKNLVYVIVRIALPFLWLLVIFGWLVVFANHLFVFLLPRTYILFVFFAVSLIVQMPFTVEFVLVLSVMAGISLSSGLISSVLFASSKHIVVTRHVTFARDVLIFCVSDNIQSISSSVLHNRSKEKSHSLSFIQTTDENVCNRWWIRSNVEIFHRWIKIKNSSLVDSLACLLWQSVICKPFFVRSIFIWSRLSLSLSLSLLNVVVIHSSILIIKPAVSVDKTTTSSLILFVVMRSRSSSTGW